MWLPPNVAFPVWPNVAVPQYGNPGTVHVWCPVATTTVWLMCPPSGNISGVAIVACQTLLVYVASLLVLWLVYLCRFCGLLPVVAFWSLRLHWFGFFYALYGTCGPFGPCGPVGVVIYGTLCVCLCGPLVLFLHVVPFLVLGRFSIPVLSVSSVGTLF